MTENWTGAISIHIGSNIPNLFLERRKRTIMCIKTPDYDPEQDRLERMKDAAEDMYKLLEECADALGAIGLPTLSKECYDLLRRIDGKKESYE